MRYFIKWEIWYTLFHVQTDVQVQIEWMNNTNKRGILDIHFQIIMQNVGEIITLIGYTPDFYTIYTHVRVFAVSL